VTERVVTNLEITVKKGQFSWSKDAGQNQPDSKNAERRKSTSPLRKGRKSEMVKLKCLIRPKEDKPSKKKVGRWPVGAPENGTQPAKKSPLTERGKSPKRKKSPTREITQSYKENESSTQKEGTKTTAS